MVNFEDFQKLELRVAKILQAEKVEGSDKLLKLFVDLGSEGTRQIIAGIGKVYQADELLGKEIVVVANLTPKVLMGFESQGMLLAANDDGKPIILVPERPVMPGVQIR